MWQPGEVVLDGRFRIVRNLGQGSATSRWLAEQVSLSRQVELQVIRPELGVKGADASRSIRRLADVDHPGVVRVIDAGQAGEVLFSVTEYVEGPSLSIELKGEPLLPERAVTLVVQLAEALAAVHARGLVHGDLRPEHVTLTAGGKVRLRDFGIAQLVDGDPADRVTVLTRTIGPMEYFSPEQALGKPPSAKSDVYALGLIAYQALSGQLPARSPAPLQKAAGHLADHTALCDCVMQCLAQAPDARPTAAEVARRLSRAPAPAEPTLFVESMQRPPELPTKPMPPELPTKPMPPEFPTKVELMPSVQMPVIEPTSASVPAVLPSPRGPNRVPLLIAGGVVIATLVAAIVWLASSGSPAAEARKLVEMRQPAQALEVINKAQRNAKGPAPELQALRAAAQHLVQDHYAEAASLEALGPAPEVLDPLVLSGPVEDFGRREDPRLRKLLEALPRKELKPALEKMAREPLSAKQWGALRWLDLENEAQGLALAQLYAASLESETCAVRKVAARRLEQLDDDSAEGALLRLRETPREGAMKSCGQDEAAAALSALKRQR